MHVQVDLDRVQGDHATRAPDEFLAGVALVQEMPDFLRRQRIGDGACRALDVIQLCIAYCRQDLVAASK